MKITYWSDYACPYCYIGEARLKKAIKDIPELKNVEIEMKAFRLDPTAGEHATGDTLDRFAHKYGISFADAGRQIESISQMGIAEGLDFKYATTLFTNTMDAHRLTKLAQSKNNPALAEKVIEALFKAYFTDNKELADKELLQKIGEECGLDAEGVKEVLSSDQYEDEVLLDEREAARYGIHGVPFFVVGRYGISGAQSVEGMKATIRQAMEESDETVTESGMSCGPAIIVKGAKYLEDGDIINLDANLDFSLQVIYTLGHTTDSVVFYSNKDHVAFVAIQSLRAVLGTISIRAAIWKTYREVL